MRAAPSRARACGFCMECRKAACTEGEVVVGEIKDEAVGVEETESSSLGSDLNTQKCPRVTQKCPRVLAAGPAPHKWSEPISQSDLWI